NRKAPPGLRGGEELSAFRVRPGGAAGNETRAGAVVALLFDEQPGGFDSALGEATRRDGRENSRGGGRDSRPPLRSEAGFRLQVVRLRADLPGARRRAVGQKAVRERRCRRSLLRYFPNCRTWRPNMNAWAFLLVGLIVGSTIG